MYFVMLIFLLLLDLFINFFLIFFFKNIFLTILRHPKLSDIATQHTRLW